MFCHKAGKLNGAWHRPEVPCAVAIATFERSSASRESAFVTLAYGSGAPQPTLPYVSVRKPAAGSPEVSRLSNSAVTTQPPLAVARNPLTVGVGTAKLPPAFTSGRHCADTPHLATTLTLSWHPK